MLFHVVQEYGSPRVLRTLRMRMRRLYVAIDDGCGGPGLCPVWCRLAVVSATLLSRD
jgi:hypothetical protein